MESRNLIIISVVVIGTLMERSIRRKRLQNPYFYEGYHKRKGELDAEFEEDAKRGRL